MLPLVAEGSDAVLVSQINVSEPFPFIPRAASLDNLLTRILIERGPGNTNMCWSWLHSFS
jgi:hypothetical protein